MVESHDHHPLVNHVIVFELVVGDWRNASLTAGSRIPNQLITHHSVILSNTYPSGITKPLLNHSSMMNYFLSAADIDLQPHLDITKALPGQDFEII